MSGWKVIEGKICVSVDACAKAIGISMESGYETVMKGIMRYREGSTSWAHYPDPDDARRKWIVVDSLPKMSRERLEVYYGDIHIKYWVEMWKTEAEKHYNPTDVTYLIGRRMKVQDAEVSAVSASWLRWLAESDDAEGFERLEDKYKMVIKVLQEVPGHNIRVSNWRSLRTKVIMWRQDGVASLISKKSGNSNSRKLCDAGRSFIINAYASALKPTVRDVHRLYVEYAGAKGWKPVDEERVRQILSEPDVLQAVSLARHGLSTTRNLYERTIKRRKPSFADALWSLDGFTIQLRYDINGKVESGIYCVGVMDVYSDRIVGFAAGVTETSTLVQKAIRNAVRSSNMLPVQLQYDNSSANKSQEATELFKRISKYAFPTAPYNGKSKPIECLIGRIEGRNMRHMANFKGGNITSPSLAIKANPDFLAGIELPDMATVIQQLDLIIRIHNNTKGADGRTPDERYNDAHPMRRQADYLTMVEAFWVQRRDPVRYDKDGLVMQVDGQRYTYEVQGEHGVEDMDFRMRWLGTRFTVKYDPDDLEYICLYHEDVWVASARRKYEAPMAIVDMHDDDKGKIKAALQARRRYMERLAADLEAHKMTVQNEDLPTELTHELLHKDAYNRLEQLILDGEIDARALEYAGYRRTEKKRKPLGLYDVDDDYDIRPVTD